MKAFFSTAILLAAILFLAAFAIGTPTALGQDSEGHSRSFRFAYDVEIKGLRPGDQVRGWIPEPIEDRYQSTELVSRSLPGEHRVSRERRYGNRTSYFETTVTSAENLHASLAWDIVRHEANPLMAPTETPALSAATQRLFLKGSKYVPVGGQTTATMIHDQPPQDALKRGEFLFDLVAEHMKYDKSRPGYGNGDAVWACNSQFGNCTDFHSLFISLARGLNLPARFEIGFSIPSDSGKHLIGGYHCWAYFSDGKQWVPVDISEGDKVSEATERPEQRKQYFGKMNADRVAFTTGRDLILTPHQAGEPLNYLIYPYIEVNGAELPRDQIVAQFTSEDR